MRKITKLASIAFWAGKSFSLDNTTVKVSSDKIEMYLHGNLIARKDLTGLYVTDAGWKTGTTKERINGILSNIGKSVYQKKGEWFFQDGTIFPPRCIIKVIKY